MMLLLQTDYSGAIIAAIIAVPAILSALIAALVARTYYRTGLDTRINTGLKEELALVERKAVRLGNELAEANRTIETLKEASDKKDTEYDVLATDYTQLSQLFAKKSVLFEIITGFYERMGNLAEAEGLQGLLRQLKPIKLRGDEEIHKTGSPDTTPNENRP